MANTPIDTSGKEVFYEINTNSLAGNTAVVYLYPPNELYNNDNEAVVNYESRPDDRIVNVDIGFLRLKHFADPDQEQYSDDGTFGKTNVSGAFYALEPDDYFFKYTGGTGDLTTPLLERGSNIPKIGEIIRLPQGSTGGTFENKSLGMFTGNINRFDDLEVDGLNEGYKPYTMPTMAVRLENNNIEDVTYRCFDELSITEPSGRVSADIGDTKVITNQIAHFNGIDADFIQEEDNTFVNNNVNWDTTKYVSAVEIINVERDVDDLRYGDAEDDLPFIFTGATHVFSDAEIALVEVGTSVPVDLTVYGGDCYIGLHTFKVNDTSYSLTDPEKLIDGTGTKAINSHSVYKWEYLFDKTSGTGTKEDVSRPYPLKGAAQTITVLLESEINPEVAEKSPHNDWTYDSIVAISNSNLPVPIADDAGQIRSAFKYRYNLDYTKENDYRVFFPYKTYDKNVTLFESRVLYSDQKVYNTDIEGFDRFRVLSVADLDETHGSINKLQETGDKIFAIQESAVSYLPIQAQVLETADAGNIAVRAGEIIGVPIKINTLYGTQNPKSVKADSTAFFFADARRGEICAYDGKQVNLVSRAGMESFFSSALSSIAGPSDISAIYDNKKKEYIIFFRESDSAVFNVGDGVWSSRYPETAEASTLGGLRVGDTMIVIGVGGSASTHALRVADLYKTGAIADWWDIVSTPTVDFYVAPEPDIVKIFDAFTIVSTRTVAPQWFKVLDFDGTVLGSSLTGVTLKYQEGTFRFKNLRVSHEDGGAASAGVLNRRMKGTYGELELNFITTEQSGMTSVLTKYRPIFRPL